MAFPPCTAENSPSSSHIVRNPTPNFLSRASRHPSLPALLTSLFLTASAPAAPPRDLVKDGRPRCVLVLPDLATPTEQYAAHEFADHIKKITGAELPLVPEKDLAPSTQPAIYLGRTQASRQLLSDERLASLHDDGYTILPKDNNLFLLGGGNRGTLYAVYDFLESLGVRWLAPDCTLLPTRRDVELPATTTRVVPPFSYRDEWWNNAATPEWLARQRINGSNGQDHQIPPDMGGSVLTLNTCHSFKDLVPPAGLFPKHPDWFALKENGNRVGKGELCLTDPDLRAFVVQRVLADLKAHSGQVDNYWVSQNDGGHSGCFCPRCTAERLAHGGADRWSANIICFVNAIADAVRPEYPNVKIKTLAYSYTQDAPEHLNAAPNVLVEICGNFDDDPNSPHRLRVAAWSKVAKNISAYTYGGSNYGYWWPYPNTTDLALQCPRALAAGVTAFYIQGAALGHGSGLVDLKAYLSARMAWDPSRDIQKEIQEFCSGYYGPAGPYIQQYLDDYTAYIRTHHLELNAGWGDPDRWRNWVTPDAMAHADALFQQAMHAVQDQPTDLAHVRQAYLEVLWGSAMIKQKPKSSLTDPTPSPLRPEDLPDIQHRAALFGQIMRENQYDKWSEISPFNAAKFPY